MHSFVAARKQNHAENLYSVSFAINGTIYFNERLIELNH